MDIHSFPKSELLEIVYAQFSACINAEVQMPNPCGLYTFTAREMKFNTEAFLTMTAVLK